VTRTTKHPAFVVTVAAKGSSYRCAVSHDTPLSVALLDGLGDTLEVICGSDCQMFIGRSSCLLV
jgi:hypothetical protein